MKYFLLLILTILFVGMITTTYYHELAHVQINNYAGIKSHTEWNLSGGVTYADENFANPQLYEQAYIGHGINESIGYQIQPMFIMLCGIIIACTIYLKRDV